MNYADIKKCDIANGVGVRVSLFVSGCTRRCKNCFNKEAWDFSYGKPFDEAAQSEVMEALAPDYIAGLSLLGGEPFEPQNQRALLPFVKKVRAAYPAKTIWAYSGYLYDEDLLPADGRAHTEDTDALLGQIDILVDGRFVEEQKELGLRFRGSANQRIIDLSTTREEGKLALWAGLKEEHS